MRSLICLAIILGVANAYVAVDTYQRPKEQRLRVMLFTEVTDFYHVSIEAGVRRFIELAPELNWDVFVVDNSTGFFTPLALSTVDIVFWLNTCGRDILNSDEKLAFQQWWEAGQRGYLGVHAAADTEQPWPFYVDLVGASFVSHPPTSPAEVNIELSTGGLRPWLRCDEWYNYHRNPRDLPGMTVHAHVDENSYPNNDDRMGDHPISWSRSFNNSRMFYTGMGHTINTYDIPDVDWVEMMRVAADYVGFRRPDVNIDHIVPDTSVVFPCDDKIQRWRRKIE